MPSNSGRLPLSVTSAQQNVRGCRGSREVNPEPEDGKDVTSQTPVRNCSLVCWWCTPPLPAPVAGQIASKPPVVDMLPAARNGTRWTTGRLKR